MPIDRIKARTISINIDGTKSIDVKTETKRGAELNKALLDPKAFKEFAKNPKEFAARFDLKIDREVSDQLVTKLRGIESLEAAGRFINPIDRVGATVWAVAVGSYSVASTKIAVAF